MTIQIHLFIVSADWYVTKDEHTTLSVYAYRSDGTYHMFYGRACHLQAWCAKREIDYKHKVLNIPIEE